MSTRQTRHYHEKKAGTVTLSVKVNKAALLEHLIAEGWIHYDVELERDMLAYALQDIVDDLLSDA